MLTATHQSDLVSQGVLLGLLPDLERIGQLAGKKLIQVLQGASPSSIPIEAPLPKLVINEKTKASGHFFIPPEVQAWAEAK